MLLGQGHEQLQPLEVPLPFGHVRQLDGPGEAGGRTVGELADLDTGEGVGRGGGRTLNWLSRRVMVAMPIEPREHFLSLNWITWVRGGQDTSKLLNVHSTQEALSYTSKV